MSSKIDMYEQMVENTKVFMLENSILRLKVETPDFDFVFEFGEDGNIEVVSTKAVIRVIGKTTKVRLTGDDTWEAAYQRTREKWSQYFKEYRQKQTPNKAADRVRARRYRSGKRAERQAFLERG